MKLQNLPTWALQSHMITSVDSEQAFAIIQYLVMLETHKLGKWENLLN